MIMLLRSASAPILHSWLPQHYCSSESSLEPDSHVLRRTRSISLYSSKSLEEHTNTLISRTQQQQQQQQQHKKTLQPLTSQAQRLVFNYGVGGEKVIDDDDRVETLVIGGGGMGSNGGDVGGSGVDVGGGNEDATDVYYREMIELNPGNSLLTGNYAKFLKEVKGDTKKAEEYCERAILGNINDGNILSLYADLILHNHGDRQRAHSYFHQAVKMSPHDCYVQAAYARFLWDVKEDEDEDEEEEEEEEVEQRSNDMAPTNIFTDVDVSQHYTSTTVSY